MDEACPLCLAGMSAGLTARPKTNPDHPAPENNRLLCGSFGIARVDTLLAPMNPQVTSVPLFGVLGVSGKKHPIDEFYILRPPCAAHMGPAHGKGIPTWGENNALSIRAAGPARFQKREKGHRPASAPLIRTRYLSNEPELLQPVADARR